MARQSADSVTIPRLDMLNALLMVQPALETRDFIEILTHLCFDGKNVFACNDVIALRVPCESPINGAVRGDVMIKLLESSAAKDVILSARTGMLTMKLVKANIELPMMTMDEITMKWPTNLKSLPKIDIKATKSGKAPQSQQEELIEALAAVFPSIATDTGNNEFFGVSVQRIGKDTNLYTTDRKGASCWELSFALLPADVAAVVLRRDFCEQMVRLFKDKSVREGPATLYFDTKQQRVYMEIDNIMLWGQAHFPEKPFDFERRVFGAKITAKAGDFAAMTPAFRQAVERARILLFDKWGAGSDIRCDGGADVEFHTVGHGQCTDAVRLDKKQMECNLYVDPQNIQRGLDVEGNDKLMTVAMNPDGIALAAGRYTYIAGTSSRPKVQDDSAKAEAAGDADDEPRGRRRAAKKDDDDDAPRASGRRRIKDDDDSDDSGEAEPEPRSRSRRR